MFDNIPENPARNESAVDQVSLESDTMQANCINKCNAYKQIHLMNNYIQSDLVNGDFLVINHVFIQSTTPSHGIWIGLSVCLLEGIRLAACCNTFSLSALHTIIHKFNCAFYTSPHTLATFCWCTCTISNAKCFFVLLNMNVSFIRNAFQNSSIGVEAIDGIA